MAIKLRQDEVIIKEAHLHWLSYLYPTLFATLFTLIVIGHIVNPKSSGIEVFWTLAIVFLPLLHTWLKNKSYSVTNQRLYVEKGILTKSKIDIPFNKINDILFNQGLLQRIFNSGNVEVMTSNDKSTKLKNLDIPEQFREALISAVSKKAV